MITVRLKGGMGNQMFQYAFAMGLASRIGTDFQLDCSVLLDRARGNDFVYRDYDLDIFQLTPNFSVSPDRLRSLYKLKSSTASRWIKQWAAKGNPIHKERHFHVDEELLTNPADNTIYDGWWQSATYFANVEAEVRNAFRFKSGILPASAELAATIKGCNAVALNVRRTDFLTTPALNSTNLGYFNRCAARIAQDVSDPHFFVFSDDIAWCRENIKLEHPVTVVTHDHKGHKFGNYMQLMMSCRHFIIPNSSFAWWSVWLNENPNKLVIAPKNWFNEGDADTRDLVPESWLRL